MILGFLKQVAANNNRAWFQEHKKEYLEARNDFEQGAEQFIVRLAEIDGCVAHLTLKDCTYRFNRDTRFSPDKSPYKRHFGAYVAAHGKKGLHGGYYIHLEPGQCLIANGSYWLPTNILASCRNEIMSNEEEWLRCVNDREFLRWYGAPEATPWEAPQGFGIAHLKTCPSGFPRDYAHLRYLRQKDYCCWHRVDDRFFEGDKWLDKVIEMGKAAKPVMDFVNNVIDDYE